MAQANVNLLNDAQFRTWMQTITQAVNGMANQPAPPARILNIAKIPDYYGTDAEDPYEWIQSVEKAAQTNDYTDAKTLQAAVNAL